MGRVSDRAPHTRSPTPLTPFLPPQLSSVRAELERETATQASATHHNPPARHCNRRSPTPLTPRFPPLPTQTHVDREAQEAEINLNRERAAAEHWRAQHERETEAHDSVQV